METKQRRSSVSQVAGNICGRECGHRSTPGRARRTKHSSKQGRERGAGVPNVRLAASYNFLVNLSNQARLKSAGEETFMRKFRERSTLRSATRGEGGGKGEQGHARLRGQWPQNTVLKLW